VVCYESRKLTENDHYVSHDLELEANIHALNMWKHYILCKKKKIMIDHSGLRYLFYQPNLNAKKARWLLTLSEFDFEITYIKGNNKKIADDLNRRV